MVKFIHTTQGSRQLSKLGKSQLEGATEGSSERRKGGSMSIADAPTGVVEGEIEAITRIV